MSKSEDNAIEALMAQRATQPVLGLSQTDLMLLEDAMDSAATALGKIGFKKHGFALFHEAQAATKRLQSAQAALRPRRAATGHDTPPEHGETG